MSLEGLFTDRKVRKLIKESVLEAQEIVQSKCSCCHSVGNTLKIGEYEVCEDCANYLTDMTEDYERAFESSYMDINNVIKDVINEAVCKIGNFQKLKDDVANKYNGDLAKLLQDYGMMKPYNCGTIIPQDKGEILVEPEDLKGGKSKVNRFIDDYALELSTRAKNQLVADPDGYISKSVGSTSNSSQSVQTAPSSVPSGAGKPATTSATKTVKEKGSGFSVEGDENKFVIKIADGISIECVLDTVNAPSTSGASSYEAKLSGTNEKPFVYTVKQADVKSMASAILDMIKDAPCNVFTSFDDEFESTKGYILPEYPYYSFMFDADSFDGKYLTLVLALNGKPYPNTRIALGMRDIISKAALDGKLLNALRDRLSKFYPCLFDGTMDIKTSLGLAVSSLSYVDDKNVVRIHTELGNNDFEWEIAGNNLKDKDLSVNSMLDAVYAKLDKIIPDWNQKANRESRKVKGYTDSFKFDIKNPDVTVYLNFSIDELYDKHDFIFHISIIDNKTGIEQPKEYAEFVYNKSGVKLEDFAKSNGEKVYKKYFNKSDMVETLSAKAYEKTQNRSKREVFLSHVANQLKICLNNDALRNLDLDIEDFDVNDEHKVTNVVFRVSDPYNDVAGTSEALKNIIKVDKESWISLVKVDDTPKSMKANGPSVIYKVTKIKDFSDCINLPLLENAMLEAFGFSTGRKVIGINEAYWKEVDGEFILTF